MMFRWACFVALAAGCPNPEERFTREELDTFRAMTALDDATAGIRDAIVRGDLYDARRRAGLLASRLPPLPDGAPDAAQNLRLALSAIRTAPSLERAADALGRVASVCSACHTDARVPVGRPPWIPSHDTRDPLASEMARHAMVVDGLWLGMIAGSDEALRGSLEPLAHVPGDPEVPARIAAADAQVHALAAAVASAPADQRGARYAELLVACADCHRNGRPAAVPQFHGASMPHLDGDMQEHFAHALELQLHVMGGELDGARLSALKLQSGPFEGVPVGAEPYVAAIRMAADQVARATSIEDAAASTAEIAAACGRCHLATGGGPTDTMGDAPTTPPTARHVYAAYWMGYGLMAADEQAWISAARSLAGATFSNGEAGPDESGIHALATRAETTVDWSERATVWGEILAGCADCHRQVTR